MAIVKALRAANPHYEVTFVSYATGAETLDRAGENVVDIAVPEDGDFIETLLRGYAVIMTFRPDLVVAHEEFAAITASRLAGTNSLYLAAWLPPRGSVEASCLVHAGKILVLGEPGIFPQLSPPTPQPRFVGPILRTFELSRSDRVSARDRLGLSNSATIIVVVQGGWATEEKAPLADVLIPAFNSLHAREKMLVWLAGRDKTLLSGRVGEASDVRVEEFHNPIDPWLVASDLLITKGTRNITLEAARLGLRSISISHRLNPIDDMLLPRIRSNTCLYADAVDQGIVCNYIEQRLTEPWPEPAIYPNGLPAVLSEIADCLTA